MNLHHTSQTSRARDTSAAGLKSVDVIRVKASHARNETITRRNKRNQGHAGVGVPPLQGGKVDPPGIWALLVSKNTYWFISLFIVALTIVGLDPLNVCRGQVVENKTSLIHSVSPTRVTITRFGNFD